MAKATDMTNQPTNTPMTSDDSEGRKDRSAESRVTAEAKEPSLPYQIIEMKHFLLVRVLFKVWADTKGFFVN